MDMVMQMKKRLNGLDASGVRYTVEAYTVDAHQDAPSQAADNPIDAWAEDRLYVSGITGDMSNDASLEMEIREKELLYTYDQLIARATPHDNAPREALEAARDALLTFAPDYGVCAALYTFSDTFMPESWQDHPDTLMPGFLMLRSMWDSAHRSRVQL